jgi:hypothetical protein
MRANGSRLFAAAIVAAMLIAVPAIAQGQGGANEAPAVEPAAEAQDQEPRRAPRNEGPPAQSSDTRDGEAEAQDDVRTQGETFQDFVNIINAAGNGTKLSLWGQGNLAANDWEVFNTADTSGGPNNRLDFRQGLNGTPRMTLAQGGNLGIGTTNPLNALHVDRIGGFQQRLSSGTNRTVFDTFGDNFRIGNFSATAGNGTQFRLFDTATTNNLVARNGNVGINAFDPQRRVDVRGPNSFFGPGIQLQGEGGNENRFEMTHNTGTAGGASFLNWHSHGGSNRMVLNHDGRLGINGTPGSPHRLQTFGGGAAFDGQVGISTTSPSADLHVNNSGGSNTNIRFENGPHIWANALNQAGNFVFNKVGTAASEVIFREFNHPNATLLVRGPVGASEFKVLPLPSSAEAQRMRASGEDPREGIDLLEQIRDLEARVAELEAKLGE